MMTYKIDKTVPLPARYSKESVERKITLRKLAAEGGIGDSVFFPRVHLRDISSTASRVGRRWFNCRTVIENGVPGVRIWKVAEPEANRPGSGTPGPDKHSHQ